MQESCRHRQSGKRHALRQPAAQHRGRFRELRAAWVGAPPGQDHDAVGCCVGQRSHRDRSGHSLSPGCAQRWKDQVFLPRRNHGAQRFEADDQTALSCENRCGQHRRSRYPPRPKPAAPAFHDVCRVMLVIPAANTVCLRDASINHGAGERVPTRRANLCRHARRLGVPGVECRPPKQRNLKKELIEFDGAARWREWPPAPTASVTLVCRPYS